jgi:CarD family transcriptional regulator
MDKKVSMDYKINDRVLYGVYGVCEVVAVTEQSVGTAHVEYYVLKPLRDPTTRIYIPTQHQALTAKMKRLLSAEEIHALIGTIPEETENWIEDGKIRHAEYRKILSSGDRTELFRLIKTIYQKQQTVAKIKKGKVIPSEDTDILKTAEGMLYEEFAHVLDIRTDQVVPFILKEIGEEKLLG